MNQALNNLLTLLNLEAIGERMFRGTSEALWRRQVFGGQLIGQALYAAKETVPVWRFVHSLHSYFLRPGDSQQSVIYDVEILRDGKSFSTRRVKATQNGHPIFYMTASFQVAEQGFEHKKMMPAVPPPDGLLTETEIAQSMEHYLPPQEKETLLNDKPLEIRPVNVYNPLKGNKSDPTSQVWMRANGHIPDYRWMHQCLLGYASDCHFLSVALQPHGIGFMESGIQVATIDHVMWFHRPFDMNDWLLYSIESTSASNSRGFVRGEFYTQDGTLVASTAQEGVIRKHN